MFRGVIENGAEGVGLYHYRSSYIWIVKMIFLVKKFNLKRKTVLESARTKSSSQNLRYRRGDKKLDHFKFPEEMNPFLGYRAIRLCLDRHILEHNCVPCCVPVSMENFVLCFR